MNLGVQGVQGSSEMRSCAVSFALGLLALFSMQTLMAAHDLQGQCDSRIVASLPCTIQGFQPRGDGASHPSPEIEVANRKAIFGWICAVINGDIGKCKLHKSGRIDRGD